MVSLDLDGAGDPTPRPARTGCSAGTSRRPSATASTSTRSRNENWWHATNSASRIRYVERDRVGAEPQVRHRHRARLLRVVDEVALRVQVGLLADELHRRLGRAHRAVAAQSVEDRPDAAVPPSRTSGPTASDVWLTSSTMPTVKWLRGRSPPRSSNTAFAIAGVNSFEDRPYRPPDDGGHRRLQARRPRRRPPPARSRRPGTAARRRRPAPWCGRGRRSAEPSAGARRAGPAPGTGGRGAPWPGRAARRGRPGPRPSRGPLPRPSPSARSTRSASGAPT